MSQLNDMHENFMTCKIPKTALKSKNRKIEFFIYLWEGRNVWQNKSERSISLAQTGDI